MKPQAQHRMSRTGLKAFFRSRDGAVAPTVALSLVALIGAGGLAFDYSRMAGMHSELQNAADQAALAAATQLDGKAGAMDRATAAASGLVANITRLANEPGSVPAVEVLAPEFFQDQDGTVATTDAEARFVRVRVDGREVRYALTPIVGALSSGMLDAIATAGLGSSICKVPPVMMCNPYEANSIGADFDAEALKGAGVRALTGAPNVPGNFGFIDSGGDNSTGGLAKKIGYDNIPGECLPTADTVGLQPGQRDVVFNAFNTRFDIDTNGANTCPGGGPCSAAVNVRKDIVRKDPSKNNSCGTTGNGWTEPVKPYRPTSTTPITSNYPDTMGHPRDICHAVSLAGTCSGGIIGNKTWDRDAYFHVNYGWDSSTWKAQTGLTASATRFEVYQWEIAHAGYLTSKAVAGGTAYSKPVCRPTAPASVPDRRRMTVAIVNCRDQAGKIAGNDEVKVLKWVDVFLVEPAFARGSGSGPRTTDDQVYVEIIGTNTAGGGADAGQVVRRDVPYLVK